jgi:DNA-directed RNA polymerase specialized sigma24 family protein|tara:strand:+ start:392 stop:973 length:582 start_codon:yes stop_codon:yes gene_type:complete
MISKKKPEHYVNNKEFLIAMTEYKRLVNLSKESGEPKPPVTNYIGTCFLKIANHLSYRPNFINYTFRDDMISDGIENCLQYLDNFNPEKSNNPFAYFTQIIYYAFVRRIQKEKKQTTIKQRMIAESNYDDMTLQPGEDREFKNMFSEFLKANLPKENSEEEAQTKATNERLKGLRKAQKVKNEETRAKAKLEK